MKPIKTPDLLRYTKVTFTRFKAFESFTLNLRHMNVMVGPNNAGKSTILAAFRILAEGLRKANRRRAELVQAPEGPRYGYTVDSSALSVGDENIFFNYHDSQPASITFSLTGRKRLVLYFPETQKCHLFADDPKTQIRSPTQFKSAFKCPIGFVPILGPVEQDEGLNQPETARRALFNYRAARNFRNIWYHNPDGFGSFRRRLQETWPGMDILKPELVISPKKNLIKMFCTEDRMTREIAWIGSGFQVWCQMLTHLVSAQNSSVFLIDEPDIYLHSDLQRRLLGLLADLGPDIVLATHSTEIISEAEAEWIVLIDKTKRTAKRIKAPTQLHEVFSRLGSGLNPLLTHLAKTRRVVFVEGNDFTILAKFARKLGLSRLANREQFAVVPIHGFNTERVRNLKESIERALGGEVRAAIVLDRDFRSREECVAIAADCRKFADIAAIHSCKELESFLLVPEAIDRAARARIAERASRTGRTTKFAEGCAAVLDSFVQSKRHYVLSQFTASRRRFVRELKSHADESTTDQAAMEAFEADWNGGVQRRLELMPAKDALSAINQHLQEHYAISVTPTSIINAMCDDEVPPEMRTLLNRLAAFVAA